MYSTIKHPHFHTQGLQVLHNRQLYIYGIAYSIMYILYNNYYCANTHTILRGFPEDGLASESSVTTDLLYPYNYGLACCKCFDNVHAMP